MKKAFFVSYVLAFAFFWTAFAQAQGTGYVYAYFKGGWPTGGHSGVFMSYSEDGLHFESLNDGNPVFVPPEAWGPGSDTDTTDEDQTRDPSVVYGPDGLYHMVWTSGIDTHTIGYASSPDLLNWTNEQLVEIWDTNVVVNHTWAPEIFYDAANSNYQIIFASDLNNGDHKLYSITTTDFSSFSDPNLYFYNNATIIDAMIAYDAANNQYLMAVKDEQGGQKNIRLATASTAQGPWTTNNPIIVGPGSAIEGNVTEGPSIVKIDDTWHLYYDAYGAGYLGVATTTDSDPTNAGSWVNMTSQSTMPVGPLAHHGTVFAAPNNSISFDLFSYSRSDLDDDEDIDADDWDIFYAAHLTAGPGDFNGNGVNDYADFVTFQGDYDTFNGTGSFQAMLTGVPEPSTATVVMCLVLCLGSVGRYRRLG